MICISSPEDADARSVYPATIRIQLWHVRIKIHKYKMQLVYIHQEDLPIVGS